MKLKLSFLIVIFILVSNTLCGEVRKRPMTDREWEEFVTGMTVASFIMLFIVVTICFVQPKKDPTNQYEYQSEKLGPEGTAWLDKKWDEHVEEVKWKEEREKKKKDRDLRTKMAQEEKEKMEQESEAEVASPQNLQKEPQDVKINVVRAKMEEIKRAKMEQIKKSQMLQEKKEKMVDPKNLPQEPQDVKKMK